MEELVTVDEVGEDDDSIIEPDLPELEKLVSCPKGTTEGEAAEEKEEKEQKGEKEEEEISPPRPCVEVQKTPAETSIQDRLSSEVAEPAGAAATAEPEPVLSARSPENPTQHPGAAEPVLGDVPTEELKAKLEETCLEDKATSDEDSPQNHKSVFEEPETVAAGPVSEPVKIEVQPRSPSLNKALSELLHTQHQSCRPFSSLCGCLSQGLTSPHPVWGRRRLPASTASLWVTMTTLES